MTRGKPGRIRPHGRYCTIVAFHSPLSLTLHVAQIAFLVFDLLAFPPPLLRPLRRLFLLLLLNLLRKAIPLRLPLPRQIGLQLQKLFTLDVHPDHAFQQLDFRRPNILVFLRFALIVLDELSVRVTHFDGRLEYKWETCEARFIDDVVESAETKEASADIGV